jgi:micrococcal nuclease
MKYIKSVSIGLTAFIFAITILFSGMSYAKDPMFGYSGKCVAVTDGDTIKVMHDGKAERIRLYGVDAPEKKQDFGMKAKQFTSDEVFGKEVDVYTMNTDRYGRTVGFVYLHGEKTVSLNAKLVANGYAWVYVQYCNNKDICSFLLNLEKVAREAKLGLWDQPNPIEPWNFRKRK